MPDSYGHHGIPGRHYENWPSSQSAYYHPFQSPTRHNGPPQMVESRDQHQPQVSSSPESRHEASPTWDHSLSFESVAPYPPMVCVPPPPPPPPQYHAQHYRPPMNFPYMPATHGEFHRPSHQQQPPPPPYHTITNNGPYWNHPGHPPVLPPIVEYITTIEPDDVLSGRGGATNSHSGNKAFRAMVKEYQSQYLKAKKRDKPAVASIVVDLIRKKGGRFLRRWDTNAAGQVLWVDIGDDRAREKTCQALREGAPELRRRKKALSSDEDDNAKPAASFTSWSKTTGTSASSPSGTLDHSTISRHHEGKADPSKTTTTTTSTLTHADDENSLLDDNEHEPLVIRPLMRLMPANKPVKPILLDQLAEADRDLYLQDFFPPCPIAQKRRAYERCTSDAATTTTSNAHIHR